MIDWWEVALAVLTGLAMAVAARDRRQANYWRELARLASERNLALYKDIERLQLKALTEARGELERPTPGPPFSPSPDP